MFVLTHDQIGYISGGVDNSEANQRIGDAIGTAYHAMTSTEAAVGGIFGLGGTIVGAIVHMNTQH